MKQFIKKCCCIYISALFSINTLILAYAQPFYENSYVNSYDTQCMIKDDKNILDQNQKNFIKKVFDENFEDRKSTRLNSSHR